MILEKLDKRLLEEKQEFKKRHVIEKEVQKKVLENVEKRQLENK